MKGLGVPLDKARGVELCRQGAEMGSSDAQADIGQYYLTGNGVPRDPVQAAHWLRKAAEQRHNNATLLLAQMY